MDKMLKTIQDYDIGVGNHWNGASGTDSDVVRVNSSSKCETTKCEVQFLLWLLLEQELRPPRRLSCFVATLRHDEDVTDTLPTKTLPSKNVNSKAKEYARSLLDSAGVELPFDSLPSECKAELFQQFCASNDLLARGKWRNLAELYEVLRQQKETEKNYENCQDLGQGEYGSVRAVICREDSEWKNAKLALKTIYVSWDALEEIQMMINECKALKSLQGHDRILTYCKSWLTLGSNTDAYYNDFQGEPLVLHILTELCGPSLTQWKENLGDQATGLEESKSLQILYQLMDGLSWIHSNMWLHLDIKPCNVFWASDACLDIKIGDFGLAIRGDVFEGQTGTVPYAAPEDRMTPKSDVYSAGVTILQVANTFHTTTELIQNIEKIGSGSFSPPTVLYSVLKKMIAKKPTDRLSARQIMNMIPCQAR